MPRGVVGGIQISSGSSIRFARGLSTLRGCESLFFRSSSEKHPGERSEPLPPSQETLTRSPSALVLIRQSFRTKTWDSSELLQSSVQMEWKKVLAIAGLLYMVFSLLLKPSKVVERFHASHDVEYNNKRNRTTWGLLIKKKSFSKNNVLIFISSSPCARTSESPSSFYMQNVTRPLDLRPGQLMHFVDEGECTGLQEISSISAEAVPQCLWCPVFSLE